MLRRFFAVESSRHEDYPRVNELNKADREKRFESVIMRYGKIISGVCFSYSATSDDFKDLRQDILINIWNGLEKFQGKSSLETWIYRVALNTCVSNVRKRSKQGKTVSLDSIMDFPDNAHNRSVENIEQLHSLIMSLSPVDKAIITMWLDERSYDEIAEIVGITRNNVAVRVNRIKQKLSKKMND